MPLRQKFAGSRELGMQLDAGCRTCFVLFMIRRSKVGDQRRSGGGPVAAADRHTGRPSSAPPRRAGLAAATGRIGDAGSLDS